MPIFAHRRVAKMLEDLSPRMTEPKRRDLINGLTHKRTGQAMAAEAELALLWAISQVAEVEIEPVIASRRRPIDCVSNDLLPGRRTAIEITAISDDEMSGDRVMRRAVSILTNEANRIRRGAGKKLYFTFNEASGFADGSFARRRLISGSFEIDAPIRAELRAWLAGWPGSQGTPLRLTNHEIDVIIQYRERVHPQYNFFCTMPAVAYSLTENTLYNALLGKEEQLPRRTSSMVRCIFVVDAGCRLLRSFGSPSRSLHEVSGEQIVEHFLQRSTVDVVCIFSPVREPMIWSLARERIEWEVHLYSRGTLSDLDQDRFRVIAEALPQARFEAYAARELHRQGALNPSARGWWLGASVTFGRAAMTAKVSARAVQEVLAGRTGADRAFRLGHDSPNVFELALSRGQTIKAARIEPAGLDDDDDYLVIEFAVDAAASKIPGGKKP